MEVKELPSEMRDRLGVQVQAAKTVVQCDICGKLFSNVGAMVGHQKWMHGPDAQPCFFQPQPKPTFAVVSSRSRWVWSCAA